uniref:Uncharacterized protein n=1 Tax=Kalanchoe fedtschenkoi TaxID=63787 RepID=A0A7N0T4Q2_KALFE
MGNCQASEAAAILIHHPDRKIERLHFSLSAEEVMNSNPGHYVAMVVTKPLSPAETGAPVNHLKLLRPSDTLQIGHVYRLISFEDVLNEFNAKKCAKLEKRMKEMEGSDQRTKQKSGADHIAALQDEDGEATGSSGGAECYMIAGGGIRLRRQQWRPALESIPEIGT